jgi:nitrogen regulatory protein P-II
MAAPIETAKIKVVTIIASSEMFDGIEAHLKAVGASGYTVVNAEGRGFHGSKRTGIFTTGNVRIETLLRPANAHRLLEHLATAYADRALTAYSQDVEAIPADHFSEHNGRSA